MTTDSYAIPPWTRDISPDVLDENGRMRVLPAEFWARTTLPERVRFGLQHGVYSFPTTELVARLKEIIGGRSAIEIGAGNGVLAEALDIPATDSMQQERPRYRKRYALTQQPPIQYGPNVIELDAKRAVRRFKPQVVIACWVTQKRDPREPWREGNPAGVVEEEIIAACESYVFVGNERTHKDKRIWDLPHEIEFPDWQYSRTMFRNCRNFIAIWPGGQQEG